MAGRGQVEAGGRSGALASAVAGAVIGAAGLAWWLLSEAERRQRAQGRLRRDPGPSRLQGTRDAGESGAFGQPPQDRELHRKVQELNQAIESVRRQLEQLQPQR